MPFNYATDELSTAAFEVLLLHPGCSRDRWIATLMEQYSIEVADAYGTNLHAVRKALLALWTHPYTDIATGTTLIYSQWATLLSSDEAVENYYVRLKNNTM